MVFAGKEACYGDYALYFEGSAFKLRVVLS
jgi:hypothetical protein